jgi:hypothetical protein
MIFQTGSKGFFKVLEVISPTKLTYGPIKYIDFVQADLVWGDWTLTDDLIFSGYYD